MKYLLLLLFLTGCASRVIVKDCYELEDGRQICKLDQNPFCAYRFDCED